MNKESIKEIMFNVRNEFENEIDDYQSKIKKELTDEDLDIMFEFLDNYIGKVELLIMEGE